MALADPVYAILVCPGEGIMVEQFDDHRGGAGAFISGIDNLDEFMELLAIFGCAPRVEILHGLRSVVVHQLGLRK